MSFDAMDIKEVKKYASMGGKATFGVRVGTAKLNDSAVRDIRSSHLTQRELAAKYGVCRSQISRVRNYEFWQHVC